MTLLSPVVSSKKVLWHYGIVDLPKTPLTLPSHTCCSMWFCCSQMDIAVCVYERASEMLETFNIFYDTRHPVQLNSLHETMEWSANVFTQFSSVSFFRWFNLDCREWKIDFWKRVLLFRRKECSSTENSKKKKLFKWPKTVSKIDWTQRK